MKQSEVVLVLSFLLCGASGAAAQETFTLAEVEADIARSKSHSQADVEPKQAITQALGARRWGMTKAELLDVLKAEIEAQFEQRIKTERDIMRQDALYQEAQERYRRLREPSNFVRFNGTKTGWDVSPVASEFMQGNDESMLVVQNGSVRELYFFMHGKLWKWYREFAADKRGTSAAEETLKALGERLGRGKPQKDRVDEGKEPYAGVTWSITGTRITALRRGLETCFVFEDKNVFDRLAALRGAARKKEVHAQATHSIDWALLQGSENDAQARQ